MVMWIVALVATFFFGALIGWGSCREQQFEDMVEDKVDDHCEHQLELQDILAQQMRHLDMTSATHEALEKTLEAIHGCTEVLRTFLSDRPDAKPEKKEVIN